MKLTFEQAQTRKSLLQNTGNEGATMQEASYIKPLAWLYSITRKHLPTWLQPEFLRTDLLNTTTYTVNEN